MLRDGDPSAFSQEIEDEGDGFGAVGKVKSFFEALLIKSGLKKVALLLDEAGKVGIAHVGIDRVALPVDDEKTAVDLAEEIDGSPIERILVDKTKVPFSDDFCLVALSEGAALRKEWGV